MVVKTREEEIREQSKHWYLDMRGTEESARAASRSHLRQANRVERCDPSQCRLIRNWRRSVLRRGADPATAPNECAAHLRNQAALYAEIANRTPDYAIEIKSREEEIRRADEKDKQHWEEKTRRLGSIDPEEWRAHWIRGIHGWRNHWQDIEDPEEGARAMSRYYLENANDEIAYCRPGSAAAARWAYSRRYGELLAELADKLHADQQITENPTDKPQNHKTVYDEAIQYGWDPKDWIMMKQNPKEEALRYSRQYLETAERVEKRDPAESILIENWRKGALLRGEDPETAVSKCIAHLRKLSAVFAELAEDAPDAAGQMRIKEEATRRDREKMVREHQEETQRLESIDPREALDAVRECGHAADLEFYNMRDGWQFRLPLANKMRSFLKLLLTYVNNRAVNDPEWFHSAVAAYYRKRHDLYVTIAETLHAEHTAMTTTKED
jgi:hypothetical protein